MSSSGQPVEESVAKRPVNGNHPPSETGKSESNSGNPELLRWRADVLMDEMMLSGVNVLAGSPLRQPPSAPSVAQTNGYGNHTNHQAYHSTTGYDPTGHDTHGHAASTHETDSQVNGRVYVYTNGGTPSGGTPNVDTPNDVPQSHPNGYISADSSPSVPNSFPTAGRETTVSPANVSPANSQTASSSPYSSNPYLTGSYTLRTGESAYAVIGGGTFARPVADRPQGSERTPENGRNDSAALLVSAEQRYAQFQKRSRSGAQTTQNEVPETGAFSAEIDANGSIAAPDAQENEPALGPVRRTVAQRRANPTQNQSATGATNGQINGAVVGSISVKTRGNRYSTLLPRASSADGQTFQREIVLLQEQVAAILPYGHESRERARGLLEKAHTILQQDALRSAEVDYYLQQVRSILLRTKQSVGDSTLYRWRLLLYLGAWLALALVAIVGCWLYDQEFAALIARMVNPAQEASATSVTTFILQQISALLITALCGGLGGALGAMVGMQRHIRRDFGFFDRKVSLRGLILPLSGMLVGILIYLVLTLPYWLMAINPMLQRWAVFLPAAVALVLAFSQEMLLGVRD